MKKFLFIFFTLVCHSISHAALPANTFTYTDDSVKGLSLKGQNLAAGTFHIFSHGRPGELFIEGRWLDAPAIAARFGSVLKEKQELYLYGCNFAAGEKGKAAAAYLKSKLGVSVSASTNVTGRNGDWVLEVGDGQNALALPGYEGNLQLDNTHYLSPITVSKYDASTISEEYIYLSTPETSNITVNMTYASGTGAPRVSVTNLTSGATSNVTDGIITFSNNNPVRIRFINMSNAPVNPGSTAITVPYATAGTIMTGAAQGLIFQSDKSFYVNYRAQSGSQAGSVMTKGKAALGKEFRWGGTPTEIPTTTPEIGNMLSIMATQNNTNVIISNIRPGTTFTNGTSSTRLQGPAIQRVLNRGESFILYAPVSLNGLTAQDNGWLGARVQSDYDISVTVGGLMQQGDANNNRDIGLDQLVPVPQLGLEHAVMQGNGGSSEKVVVIATEDDTKIYVNGSTTAIATLALAGDYTIIPAASFQNGNMFLRSSKRVYIFHKIYGDTKTNTNSFMFIPPIDCFGQKEVNLIPDARRIGVTDYVGTQLVVLAAAGTGNKPQVSLGTATLQSTETNGSALPGNAQWVTYRYSVSEPGNIKVKSQSAIQAQIFGANSNAGFGGYYSGFGKSPVANITINNIYATACIGTSVLTTEAGLGTYQWYRNNIAIPGATSNTYTFSPTNGDGVSATYYVVVTVPGGCTIRSNEIRSEICPCPKPGATGTPASYTDFGISTRDTRTTANWPKDVPNGFIALESNSKGFVITRIASPETSVTNPVEGMLVYDTANECLKLYNGTSWKCIKQTCNN